MSLKNHTFEGVSRATALSSSVSASASVAVSTRQLIYHNFFQRELVYLYFQCSRKSKPQHIEALSKRFDNVLSVLDRLRFETGQSPVVKSSLGQSPEEFNRDLVPFESFNGIKIKLKLKIKTEFDEWLPYLNYFYTLIAHIRSEKGEHDLTYMMLFVFYEHFPSLTLQFVHFLIGTNRIQLGCWRDVKYLCDYFYKNSKSIEHPVIKTCISLMNQQLSADIDRRRFETGLCPVVKSSLGQSPEEFNRDLVPFEFFNGIKLYNCESISNVSKWIPREHKKFDWLFTELVLHWFSTYEDSSTIHIPFSLKKKTYRKNVSLLNSMLDTPQIKLCAQQKEEIIPKRVSKLTYEKQPRLIYTKPADECNTYCKEYLTAQYIDSDFGNGLLKRKWTHVVSGSGEDSTQKADTSGAGFEIPVAYYVKEAFSILKQLGVTNRTGGEGDAETKFRIQLLNAKWEGFSNRFIEMRQEAHIIPLLDISYSMRNMDDETYYTAIGFAILFSQISVLGKRILTVDNLPNWINLEKATTFFEMVETFCASTKSSGSTVPNFFGAIDLIVYSIQNTNIDTDYLDKLQLVFLSDFSSYKNDILNLTMLMDDTFTYSLHKNICRRFEIQYANANANANSGEECLDNMPNIVYWNLSKTGFVDLPCSIYEDKTLFLSGFSSSLIAMIMKNKYNNPYEGLCYILQHPKYDVLRETVDEEKHYTFIP